MKDLSHIEEKVKTLAVEGRVPLPVVLVTVEGDEIVDVRLESEDFLTAILAIQEVRKSRDRKEVKVER